MTLYAIADAIHAVNKAREDIRVLSVGVGVYPEPKPDWKMWFAKRYLVSVQLLQKTLEINTQSMEQLRAILFKDIAWNHRTTELAEYAANLYLDSLNVLGDMTLDGTLRVAFLGRPLSDEDASRPFGPGWAAILQFIDSRDTEFLKTHARLTIEMFLDWRHAVQPECPEPPGLKFAAALVRKIWTIASESDERFERLFGEENVYRPANRNVLAWLVAACAGGLDEEIVREGPWGIFRLFEAGTNGAVMETDDVFTVTWQMTAPPVTVTMEVKPVRGAQPFPTSFFRATNCPPSIGDGFGKG